MFGRSPHSFCSFVKGYSLNEFLENELCFSTSDKVGVLFIIDLILRYSSFISLADGFLDTAYRQLQQENDYNSYISFLFYSANVYLTHPI